MVPEFEEWSDTKQDAFAKKIERTLHVTLDRKRWKGKDSWRCSACKSGKEDIDAADSSLREREYNHRAECRLCAVARIGRSGSGDCGD